MKVDFNKWKDEDEEEDEMNGGDFDFQNYMSKLDAGGAGAPNLDDFDDDDDKDDEDDGVLRFVHCFTASNHCCYRKMSFSLVLFSVLFWKVSNFQLEIILDLVEKEVNIFVFFKVWRSFY